MEVEVRKTIGVISIVVVLAIVLSLVLSGTVFAGNGSSSEGTGPGLENRWGGGSACTGQCQGYGESSECTGPGLMNRWGKTAK